MEERNVHPQRSRSQIWWTTGVMLATTLGAAIITRQGPTTLENAMASAALVAAGTLGVAAIGARTTRYPLWSYWTAAGIMAAAALIGPITASSPEQWREHGSGTSWMLPWFFTVLLVLPAPRAGVCAPAHRNSSWMLVGVSLVVSTILLLATRLSAL